MNKHLILIGFKSSGKTTYGRALAKKLGKSFFDLDDIIQDIYQTEYQERIPAYLIYRKVGAKSFIEMEQKAIKQLTNKSFAIIATTGATPLIQKNVSLLRKLGILVMLKPPKSIIIERWTANRLPEFIDINNIQESCKKVYSKRLQLYQNAADIYLSTKNKTDNSILEQLSNIIQTFIQK